LRLDGSVAEQGVLRAGNVGLGDFGEMVLIVGVGGRGFSIADGMLATDNIGRYRESEVK
jgi:hypothetical protein